jgi:ABC-2 type transport system permease protein
MKRRQLIQLGKLFAVAKMSFRITAMNKAFLLITLLGPFFIGAIAILPGALAAGDGGMAERIEVGLVSDLKTFPNLAERVETELSETPVVIRSFSSAAEASRAVEDRQIAGFIEIGEAPSRADRYLYRSRTGTDHHTVILLENALGRIAKVAILEEAGLSPELLAELENSPRVEPVKLTGGSGNGGFMGVFLATMTFVMMLYMTILLYGQMIGRSVVQEKSSRTVEIMLSSLRPEELMFGKILGIGAAGLLQYALWFALAGVLLSLAASLFAFQIPALVSPGSFGLLLAFFLPAYFLYSAIYAGIGAAAEDEQHMGQLGFPVILFLMVPLILISSIVMNPSSPLSLFLSFFPMTSPIVMFIRILVEQPPVWQVLLSYALLITSIVAAAVLGGKIFRIGILMTGKRPSLKEVLRWL